MFSIDTFCKLQNQRKTCMPIQYNKLVTGGNNPNITKAMRYSQYVQTTKSKKVSISTTDQQLAAKGILSI